MFCCKEKGRSIVVTAFVIKLDEIIAQLYTNMDVAKEKEKKRFSMCSNSRLRRTSDAGQRAKMQVDMVGAY